MRRLLSLGTLGLLAMIVALVLSGPAAARTGTGVYTVKAGQTMYLTNMSLNSTMSSDWVWFYAYDSQGVGVATFFLGSTYSSQTSTSWTNTSGSTAYVVFELTDNTYSAANGMPYYISDGSSTNTTTSVSHATNGYLKGKAIVSITDTGGGAYANSVYMPALGQGNFNATVSIKR
jgi:hypothetical protein